MSTVWQIAHFKKLLISRTISNIGNGIAPIAIAFGVLNLPGASPTDLSIVLASQAVPLVLLLPIGGVVADKLGRARVIAVTDMVLSAFVMTTAILFLTDNATVPLLALLGAIYGSLAAFWAIAMYVIISLFEQRSLKHILINCGYVAVYFSVIGFILGIWR